MSTDATTIWADALRDVLRDALIKASETILSMKVEAETAAQGDEQMMLEACAQISNEGLEADMAIRAALATAAQPPAGFVMVPVELASRVQETIGEFLMGHDWRQADMDTSDEFIAALAAAPEAEPAPPDYADAYEGAREDLAIWKRRALVAERDLRKEREVSSRLASEINAANGPTHLGEPA